MLSHPPKEKERIKKVDQTNLAKDVPQTRRGQEVNGRASEGRRNK